MQALDQLARIRPLAVKLGDSLGDDLYRTPPGGVNNPLWNLGHMAVTAGLLVYRLSGLELGFDPALAEEFGKGSSPATWKRRPEWAELRALLLEQPAAIAADLAAGRFQGFQRYETSAGVTLEDVTDAISFDLFHEGLHLGYTLAQRKALAAG